MKELVISVAILRYPEGWRVVADGGPMGCYADQADAEDAAQRFAAASQGSGRPIESCSKTHRVNCTVSSDMDQLRNLLPRRV